MKFQLKIKKRYWFILLTVVFAYFFFLGNRLIEPMLLSVARFEVQSGMNHLLHSSIHSIKIDDELIISETDREGQIVRLVFDTPKMNQLLVDALEVIHKKIASAENGESDPYTGEIYFDDGIIGEVPLGYFSELAFLQSAGPKIKIKARVINRISGTLDIQNEPYGMNSTLVKVMLNVKITADVFAGISSEEIEIEESIPLLVQIVNAPLPKVFPYLAPKN